MKDILDAVYLSINEKHLTQWIMKYCYPNLTTMVFKVYENTGLNSTFLTVNNLFLYTVMTLGLLK